MKALRFSNQYKRDVKLQAKRGKDRAKLAAVIDRLLNAEALPERARDHLLSGDYDGFRECHIQPDWLLIYQAGDDWVYLLRTGSHSDLFG